ncbi:glycosyltransferase family 4 protein [Priestia megaterium]|uniref:glycosyltransferase family 4 protein n=1 Tax=Priestia megaterium TaxID=1404 RepID=UPI00279557AA|nr:glycosyltransferase [Priestia megaterium]
MKSKIGIIGHFGFGKEFLDGQTIKTKILYEELRNILGEEQVLYLDTYNFKKNLFKMLIKSMKLSFKTENIVINLSKRGRNVFIPIFYYLKKIFGIRVHCMVIGGGFADQMRDNKYVRNISKKIDGIYVETNVMLDALKELGYQNVKHLNNFKSLEIIHKSKLNSEVNTPLRICTFSRVVKEKGIEVIMDAIEMINQKEKKVVYTLDIYGQIDEKYLSEFKNKMENSPEYIKYKGMIDYDKSVDIIQDYFLLAFPTLYRTEGVPGTIIDAYASGVPVISSDWDSCNDVIDDNITGIIFKLGDVNDLKSKLEEVCADPHRITNMKENCLGKALEYSSHVVIPKFLDSLD